MKYEMDGCRILSEIDFLKEIALIFCIPPHYGRNLDVLWDFLSTDLERPVKLIWKNSQISSNAMGAQFGRSVALLQKIQQQDIDWGLDERFEIFLE